MRPVYSRLWAVADYEEGSRYPTWPLPSSVYPNTCTALYPATSHVLRLAFRSVRAEQQYINSVLPCSGGLTLDGVTAVRPDTTGLVSLKLGEEELLPLGLADLGREVADQGVDYQVCMDRFIERIILK